MTRLVLTSDLHGALPEIPKCDILVLSGDLCNDYMVMRRMAVAGGLLTNEKVNNGEQQQRHWLDTEFREWLESVPAKHIVGIAGNHDFVFERPFLVPDLPWHYLQDSSVELEGLKFYGYPWIPRLDNWAFYGGSEDKRYDRTAKIPECDILISHGPPYGYGDKAKNKDEHAGCKALERELPRILPKMLVCGHIHEGYGHYRHPHTDVYNVALMDLTYDPVNPPVVVDL